MAEPQSNAQNQLATPNTQRRYEVHRSDLPLHCPLPGHSEWNSHPRVFIPVEDTGEARCPYCSAEFVLVD